MFMMCPVVLLMALTLPASGTPSKSDSATVTKRLQAARSIASDLLNDSVEMGFAARRSTGERVWFPDREKALRDIRDLNETANELLELQPIASARQAAVIDRLKPLLRDLARNTKVLMEHVEAGGDQARTGAYTEYVAAHEEITRRLVSSIIDIIDHPEKAKVRR